VSPSSLCLRYPPLVQVRKTRTFLSRYLPPALEREIFIDNLLVRMHFIIVMIRRTGLAPWEFEFPFPGSLTSTFLDATPPSGVRRRVGSPRVRSLRSPAAPASRFRVHLGIQSRVGWPE